MFKLHIYNPEHDIALGKNTEFFTPPKAARLTRDLFCHRPALWAENGDWVLVDDVKRAEQNLQSEARKHASVRFVTWAELRRLKQSELPSKIEPWGWDRFLVSQLLRCNPLFASLVPSQEQLDIIRQLSSRQFVAGSLLPQILACDERFVGEMRVCRSADEILAELSKTSGSIVVKSPWSCSGRGVRFFHSALTESERGWVNNILQEQGYILVEPLYNKVLDFALEFCSDKDGVEFRGINVFETREGKYIGNIGESEEERMLILQKHIPLELIERVKRKITELTTDVFQNRYEGSFGIDMMIVQTDQNETKVHPCVEMNLRRTMGQSY